MIAPEILFSIANIILTIAALPNIKNLIINRRNLRGFSRVGGFLTFLPILIIDVAYFIQGFYIPIILGVPTLMFWFGVMIYAK